MRIKVNLDKIQNIDSDSFYSSKSEIIKTMEKVENFSCLVSGYRGVGKTTLVKTIEKYFRESKKLNIFIYQNLDKYENYSLLLRKLIRELFLQISSDERFDSFKKDEVDLYERIGSLHENSFFNISSKNSTNVYHEKKKVLSAYVNLGMFIKNSLPVIGMLVAAINWKTDFIVKNIGFSGVVATFFWFLINNFNLGYTLENKKSGSKEVEKTLLFDDEIAEYHLQSILSDLQKAGVRVFFVFDEIDKIDDTEKLKKILSDIKHLLLLENSSSIVISGQDLFYEYALSEIKDDGLISNIFSLNVHVSLLAEDVLQEMSKNYFSKCELNEDEIKKENYIDSIILNTRKVARNMNNFILSEMKWYTDDPCIEISEEKTMEYEIDSKILNTIRNIEDRVILKLGVESALADLLVYHLFLWVKKMKLSKDYYFLEEDIFSILDEDIQKYPYWYRERLLFIFQVLIERMEENGLIETSYDDSDNKGFHLINSDSNENNEMYKESEMDFFKEYIALEKVLREFNADFPVKGNRVYNTKQIIENLNKEGVIDGNIVETIVSASQLRNRIAHGQELSLADIKFMKSISIRNLINLIYEQYSYFCIRKLESVLDTINIRKMIGKDAGKADFTVQRQDKIDILFEVKIVNQLKNYIGTNSHWFNLLNSYNEQTNKNNMLIVLVFIKDNKGLNYGTPKIENTELLIEKNIFVVYIPKINSNSIFKTISQIIYSQDKKSAK